jgi:hypothetical protein
MKRRVEETKVNSSDPLQRPIARLRITREVSKQANRSAE